MTTKKEIQIDYFAALREQRGLKSERRATVAGTWRQLYAELQSEFGFTLPAESVKVAVDDELCAWDGAVKTGSKVVFIPPVSGG